MSKSHFLSAVFLLLIPIIAAATELPPDVEVAELEATLAVDPADISAWIRLGDLQRFMGYRVEGRASLERAADLIRALPDEEGRTYAGDYYLARAWMEYDSGDWTLAQDLADEAVDHDPRTEAYLVRALATASFQYRRGVFARFRPPEIKRVGKPIWFSFNQGYVNGKRNRYWFAMVRTHATRYFDKHMFGRTVSHAYQKPPYFWGEMECRRDWGAFYEDKGMWEQARQMYIWSDERSPVSAGDWATRHERLTILQESDAHPLLFWTNAGGGYVTGSPLAYSEYACEMMLAATREEDRLRWADNLAFGSTRCLAVLTNHPLPWLWRGLADLFRGDLKHGPHDIAQARAEFDALGQDHPLYAFAFGHEKLMKGRHMAAVHWLEKASAGMPDNAMVWSELGTAYGRAQRPALALEAFNRALSIQPDMVSALFNRGMIHLKAGHPAEAKVDFIRAIELDPGNVQIMTEIQRAHVLERDTAVQAANSMAP